VELPGSHTHSHSITASISNPITYTDSISNFFTFSIPNPLSITEPLAYTLTFTVASTPICTSIDR
jgi:hypothetical protein